MRKNRGMSLLCIFTAPSIYKHKIHLEWLLLSTQAQIPLDGHSHAYRSYYFSVEGKAKRRYSIIQGDLAQHVPMMWEVSAHRSGYLCVYVLRGHVSEVMWNLSANQPAKISCIATSIGHTIKGGAI
eukprot:833793-Amorphochlora_amoeboformis.AAC.1